LFDKFWYNKKSNLQKCSGEHKTKSCSKWTLP
jgi:hypothetical protein